MPTDNPQPKQHLSRDELIREFHLNPTAFVRQLSNAHTAPDQKPQPNTHLLTWAGGKHSDKGLFGQAEIEFLLDYILKLEKEVAELFVQVEHQKSIKELVENRHLTGFDKVQ